MSERAMTIVVPLDPPKETSPNGGHHWRRKAAARAELRLAAKAGAFNVLQRYPEEPIFTGPVLVSAVIYWGKGRKMCDRDNALAMLKGAIDGCTDAGVWTDDKQCRFAPVEQERSPESFGFVRLEVRELVPAVGVEPGGDA